MLFDSHCHLTDPRFGDEADAVIARAREAGVSRIVTIASNVADAARAMDVARRSDGVWCTAGLHPHEAAKLDDAARETIRAMVGEPKVVAIGECGLDYYYDNAPRDSQRACFRWQLELAAETGLPVVVHSRDSDGDMAAMLREHGASVRGVLHCYASGPELLRTGLELGWYISFSGLVTFKNYEGADLVRAVPADRLMVETDAPYLAPVPLRGKRNEPAFVTHVADVVAGMRGVDSEVLAAETTANALRFYALPG